MQALVTGAAGFFGSTLAGRLLADGHDVGVDAFNDNYDPRAKHTTGQRRWRGPPLAGVLRTFRPWLATNVHHHRLVATTPPMASAHAAAVTP